MQGVIIATFCLRKEAKVYLIDLVSFVIILYLVLKKYMKQEHRIALMFYVNILQEKIT